MSTPNTAVTKPEPLVITVDRDMTEFTGDAGALRQSIETLAVVDAESFELAGSIVVTCKNKIAEIKKHDKYKKLDGVRDRLHKTWRETVALLASVPAPWQGIIDILEPRMVKWLQQQGAIEEAAQRKRDAEEAARLSKIAAEAEALRDRGEMKAAAQIEAAPPPPMAVIQPSVPTVAGLQPKLPWAAEVTDLKALVEAIALGKVPLWYEVASSTGDKDSLLVVNDALLQAMARRLQGDLKLPGVRAFQRVQFARSRS